MMILYSVGWDIGHAPSSIENNSLPTWQWPYQRGVRLALEPHTGVGAVKPRRPRRKTGVAAALERDRLLVLLTRHYPAIRPERKGSVTTELALLACLIEAPGGRVGQAITVGALAQRVGRSKRWVREVLKQLEGPEFDLIQRHREPKRPDESEIDIRKLRAALQKAASGVSR